MHVNPVEGEFWSKNQLLSVAEPGGPSAAPVGPNSFVFADFFTADGHRRLPPPGLAPLSLMKQLLPF